MSHCTGEGCNHPGCNAATPDTSVTDLRNALDPIVKYDGQGNPVRASQMGNRAERRAAARAARRRR